MVAHNPKFGGHGGACAPSPALRPHGAPCAPFAPSRNLAFACDGKLPVPELWPVGRLRAVRGGAARGRGGAGDGLRRRHEDQRPGARLGHVRKRADRILRGARGCGVFFTALALSFVFAQVHSAPVQHLAGLARECVPVHALNGCGAAGQVRSLDPRQGVGRHLAQPAHRDHAGEEPWDQSESTRARLLGRFLADVPCLQASE